MESSYTLSDESESEEYDYWSLVAEKLLRIIKEKDPFFGQKYDFDDVITDLIEYLLEYK